MKFPLVTFLLVFPFLVSAKTQVQVDSPIHPSQLAALQNIRMSCSGQGLKTVAKIFLTDSGEDPDGNSEFSGNLTALAQYRGQNILLINDEAKSPNDARQVSLGLDGNIDAANRIYRGNLDLRSARRALFDHQTHRLNLMDSRRGMNVNLAKDFRFRMISSSKNIFNLRARGVEVEVLDTTPLAKGQSSRILYRVSATCNLRLQFQALETLPGAESEVKNFQKN